MSRSQPDTIHPAEHPALRGFREVLVLSGFSGATVALIRDGRAPFVRKASNLIEGNAGLRDQAVRQEALARVIEGCATMPRVLDTGECEGLFYFDMAFVPSRDAVNYLAHGSFESVHDFAARVERLMERLASSPSVSSSPIRPGKSLIAEKLRQIAGRTGAIHDVALGLLHDAIERLDSVASDETPTAVHGDLTFENILIDRRGDLCLIDTIASPFDHYSIDWSKLFQECEGLWHAHRGRPLARGVTWWLRQRFHKAAARLDPGYPARHYVLLGLTFARILPYTKSEQDRVFVNHRVNECGRAALNYL